MSASPHHGGHETRDIRVRPLVLATVGFVALIAFAFAGMWGLLQFDRRQAALSDPPANPLAASHGRKLPPEPRLQADPLADLETLRAAEDEWLNSYGWVDRQAGVVRIPIDEAMRLVAEKAR